MTGPEKSRRLPKMPGLHQPPYNIEYSNNTSIQPKARTRMDDPKYLISATLYIRGVNLDPDQASDALGQQPDYLQRNGQKDFGENGRIYTKKIGIWSLNSPKNDESGIISDSIDSVLSRINFKEKEIMNVKNVEDLFFDIFITMDADEFGGGTCEFEMSPSQVKKIADLGASIQFTIAVVEK